MPYLKKVLGLYDAITKKLILCPGICASGVMYEAQPKPGYESPATSIFLSLSHILWLLPMSGLWIS